MAEIRTEVTNEELEEINATMKLFEYKSKRTFILDAIRAYRDIRYMDDKATILNTELQRAIEVTLNKTERRLGNRFAKLMGEIAVQETIIQNILKEELNVPDKIVHDARIEAIEKIQKKQSILKYEDLSD